MKTNQQGNLFAQIAGIGSIESDSDEVKLQKSLLVICSIPFIIASAGWGLMYILFGEIIAGIIPLSYSFISFASVIYFGLTRKFKVFRFSQLLLILLLPFALMVSLGGFINGSAVIIWSLMSPLGAMLFSKKSKAGLWLIAFVVLITFSYFIHPWLRPTNNLSDGQILFFFFINLAGVGAIVFFMFYYFVAKKDFFQLQSELLLLNILPKEIAAELKAKGSVEAKQFNNVTVMFTDFKNFTHISETLTPAELVSEINTLFKEFDRIITKHNVEKIKTIGDSYMCAGGLPVSNTTHGKDVVHAAIEIQQFMCNRSIKSQSADKPVFEIRIGVHSGPVVAGVVGDKKFAYDIWGDTVNVASRVESSCETGKINISGSTYELVKDKFNCTYRGKIEAKNKGDIDMYFVEAPRRPQPLG